MDSLVPLLDAGNHSDSWLESRRSPVFLLDGMQGAIRYKIPTSSFLPSFLQSLHNSSHVHSISVSPLLWRSIHSAHHVLLAKRDMLLDGLLSSNKVFPFFLQPMNCHGSQKIRTRAAGCGRVPRFWTRRLRNVSVPESVVRRVEEAQDVVSKMTQQAGSWARNRTEWIVEGFDSKVYFEKRSVEEYCSSFAHDRICFVGESLIRQWPPTFNFRLTHPLHFNRSTYGAFEALLGNFRDDFWTYKYPGGCFETVCG